jgi:hypothetical protein
MKKSPLMKSKIDSLVFTCGKLWVKWGKFYKACGNSGESMG